MTIPDETVEVYFQQGDSPLREIIQPERFVYAKPDNKQSTPPLIEPAIPEIEEGESLEVSRHCFDSTSSI